MVLSCHVFGNLFQQSREARADGDGDTEGYGSTAEIMRALPPGWVLGWVLFQCQEIPFILKQLQEQESLLPSVFWMMKRKHKNIK